MTPRNGSENGPGGRPAGEEAESAATTVKLVNLTPHEINIYSQSGQGIVLSIPPSGVVCRVSVKSEIVGKVNGVPVRKVTYGDVEGLPEPQPNTIFIVSTFVLLALKDKGVQRPDLVSTDTNPDSAIRDQQGKIIGIKYFQVV
jgi:hypothetical protein